MKYDTVISMCCSTFHWRTLLQEAGFFDLIWMISPPLNHPWTDAAISTSTSTQTWTIKSGLINLFREWEQLRETVCVGRVIYPEGRVSNAIQPKDPTDVFLVIYNLKHKIPTVCRNWMIHEYYMACLRLVVINDNLKFHSYQTSMAEHTFDTSWILDKDKTKLLHRYSFMCN